MARPRASGWLVALVAAWLCAISAAPRLHAAELPGAAPLRAAIEDLTATFGRRYPHGHAYLARLEKLEAEASAAQPDRLQQLLAGLEALRREALIANPLVSARPILFVVRRQYRPDHHNTETMFQTGEINTGSFEGGGAIKAIDFSPHSDPLPEGEGTKGPHLDLLAEGEGRVKTLLDLPDGVARDPDVHFSGGKVLFSMRRNRQDDYHVYEINADGSALRQLTSGPGVTDIDPIYLPDGRILFTSTREPKYCMCNRHIMGNLFVAEGDGTAVRQIGRSTLHEGHASLAPDGRVLYDRWEYVDRNFGDAQGVWSVNPDGTNHAIYWGNNTNSPGAVLDARALPSSERFIATFSSCHDRPWGAIALVDRRLGLDGRTPVVRTWPPGAIDLVGVGNYDTFTRVQPKYEDPYPLSDKYFLCSRMIGAGVRGTNAEQPGRPHHKAAPDQMALVLLDVFGNEIVLHAEGPGCFDPMPLGPRPRPQAIPGRTDLAQDQGFFYLADAYQGTGMDRIPRGTVKWLRVVESPEKRFWTHPAWDGGTGQQAPGMAWDDFNNKRIVGTAPVEPDGSAYFAVPADTYVYFQLLDARGMMVQSMRSGTIVRPGETTGCLGCHDERRATVPPGPGRTAMRRPASRLAPWHGPARTFSYAAEVQPVLDKHCVKCHDYGTDGGKKLNLAGDLNLVFNTSYAELRGKRYVHVVGAGPYQVQMPLSWGSHASKLVKVLLEGHGKPEIDREVKLDAEAFDRIVTWIDVNAPYYGEYASAQPGNLYGRSPLSAGQLARLGELTGVNLADRALAGHVNFTRPEHSPCLAAMAPKNGPRYQEALGIICEGKKELSARPRPDMPGFRLVDPGEIARQEKYDALRAAEAAARRAVVQGRNRP